MKGFRVSLIGAFAASAVPAARAAETCSGEACEGSVDSSYMAALSSMNSSELSVNLLQRKASYVVDEQATCKMSCATKKMPWRKLCKKSACSACPECDFQSGPYVLDGDGECRGSKAGDNRPQYALNFDAYMLGGKSMGHGILPNPWKSDSEKVWYSKPSTRVETEAFSVVSSTCGEICDALSFCKGYQIILRGCEFLKPGKTAKSRDTCEYAYGGKCYCWTAPSCYIVTDYKTYKNSKEAEGAGMAMNWGNTKTFKTDIGEVRAKTYAGGNGNADADVMIGGKKTKQYARSGYFCFMKNRNGAALAEIEEADVDDAAVDTEDDEFEDELTWPTSALVTTMCENGTLLPVAAGEPFC